MEDAPLRKPVSTYKRLTIETCDNKPEPHLMLDRTTDIAQVLDCVSDDHAPISL